MLDLIKKIDYAWIKGIDYAWIKGNKLFGIYPEKTKGYFNFRNNVILEYNRQFKKEGN